MLRNIAGRLFLVSFLLLLIGCAPPGYENAAFTQVTWPTSDQALDIDQRAEIEGRLKFLGYHNEKADGIISVGTRNGIRKFQRDIGAPTTGHLSVPLLDALRLNTGFLTAAELRSQNASQVVARVSQQRAQSQSRRPSGSTTTSTPAPNRGGDDGGDDSGGGSDGSGAGAWD